MTDPRSGRWSRNGWLLALVVIAGWQVAYLWLSHRAAGSFGLPLDDAWIHARVARNLLAGHGLVFNPGEDASATTAPLWTLLTAVPMALGIPVPVGLCLLGAAVCGVVAWLTCRFVLAAGCDAVAAATAGALVVSTHPFPWAQVSGMEPALATALVLATLLAVANRRTGLALFWAGAASLTRPELAILPVLVLIDAVLRPPVAASRNRAILLCLGTAVAAAAPFLINLTLSGSALPGAFAAKVGHHGIIAALLEGRFDAAGRVILVNVPTYTWQYLNALAADNFLLLLLAPLGFARLARGAAGTHVPWLLVVGQPLAMAVLAPFGGPQFQEQRYMAHLAAVAAVAGVIGLAATPAWRRRSVRALAIAVVALVSAASAARGMMRYATEVRNITEMQVRAGRWLAERPGGPGFIATNDIGAIGFITGAPILDTTGLATPEVIPYLRRPPAPDTPDMPDMPNRGWNGASETGLLEYLRRREPKYVAIFPSWYPSPWFQAALGDVVLQIDIDDNLICGDRTLLIYRPDWGRTEGFRLRE